MIPATWVPCPDSSVSGEGGSAGVVGSIMPVKSRWRPKVGDFPRTFPSGSFARRISSRFESGRAEKCGWVASIPVSMTAQTIRLPVAAYERRAASALTVGAERSIWASSG